MIIEIETDRLNADISTMRHELEELRNAQTQVYSSLENLRSMWEGPAQMTFYMQTETDRMMLQGLFRNINNLIECMEYAKSEYTRCTDEVLEKIAGIRLSGAR